MSRLMVMMVFLGFVFQHSVHARGFGKKDIDFFCKDKQVDVDASPIQPNGKHAMRGVLGMKAGMYSYPNGGGLLLFANGHYILKLPSNRDGIHGTDGDDLLASGGIVGGCSKAQLSEAIAKNHLNYRAFVLRKRYR